MGPLVFYSDAFLTELTWQVLIEGYLSFILFVHQSTLNDLSKIDNQLIFWKTTTNIAHLYLLKKKQKLSCRH